MIWTPKHSDTQSAYALSGVNPQLVTYQPMGCRLGAIMQSQRNMEQQLLAITDVVQVKWVPKTSDSRVMRGFISHLTLLQSDLHDKLLVLSNMGLS